MNVVIADTSPINYLILIECIDILPELYGSIVVPQDVFDELTAPGAPAMVDAWARTSPPWLIIRPAPLPLSIGSYESELDAGELAAIGLALALATEGNECLLLIDEAAGRAAATNLGIPNTGTLGILLAAARTGRVDLRTSLDRLQRTNFRISQALLQKLLKQNT